MLMPRLISTSFTSCCAQGKSLCAGLLMPLILALGVPCVGAADLNTLVEEALEQHPRALIAKATLESSRASTWIAASAHLPRVNLTSSWRRYEDIGMPAFSPYELDQETQVHSLIISQPIFAGGSISFQTLGAWNQWKAAELSHRATLAELAYDLRAGLVNYLVAKEDLLSREAALAFAAGQLRRALAQEELGILSAVDRLFFANAKAQAELGLQGAQTQVLATRFALEELLETDLGEISLNENLETLLSDLLECEEKRLGKESEKRVILAQEIAKHTAKAAHYQALAADGRLLPNLSAQMTFSNAGSDAFAYNGDFTDRTVGLSLNWPLFQSGAGLASSWSAHANSKAAKQQFEYSQVVFEKQVDLLEFSSRQALKQLELTQSSVDLALQGRDLLVAKQHLGMISVTDLLQAERDLRAAQSAFVHAQAARLKSVWALWKIEGLCR
jgi:outer membrane protein TolC